jgi:hypothetical protein
VTADPTPGFGYVLAGKSLTTTMWGAIIYGNTGNDEAASHHGTERGVASERQVKKGPTLGSDAKHVDIRQNSTTLI